MKSVLTTENQQEEYNLPLDTLERPNKMHISDGTTLAGGTKPPLPPSFRAGSFSKRPRASTPSQIRSIPSLCYAYLPQTPDVLSLSSSSSSSSSYDESDTDKPCERNQQDMDLDNSNSSFVVTPQRNVTASLHTVAPSLSSFYPAKYLLLTADTDSHSVTSATQGSFYSRLRPRNIWSTAVLVASFMELLCCWPKALERIRDVSSEKAVRFSSRTTSNRWLSLFGILVSQIKTSAIISNVANASVYKVVELYHKPHMYYQDHFKRGSSSQISKNFALSDTIHLIFICVWCIQHTCKAWDQAQRLSNQKFENPGSARRLQGCLLFVIKVFAFSILLSFYLTLLPILEEKETFNGRSRRPRNGKYISIVELLLLYIYRWMHSTAFMHLRSKLVTVGLNISTYAIQNPAKFVLRVKRILSYIRWAKLLAPLFGKCNKLRGHTLDLIKKSKQRIRLLKARTEWDILLRRVSAQRKMKDVLVRLQSSLQERREKKLLTVIRTMKETPRTDASARINTWLCQNAAYARKRTERAKSFDAESPGRKRARQMTDEERLLLVKANKGFIKTSCANRKMLLRPNTKFSVYWKCITVACVFLEVLQTVLSPKMLGQRYFVISSLHNAVLLRGMTGKCIEDKRIRREIANKVINVTCLSSPTQAHIVVRLWLGFVHYFSSIVTCVIGSVCFLDVFVSFWTGEVHNATRKLVVKPFFQRWIVPGVALQLVVNPTMTHAVTLLHKVFRALNAVGFSRVLCIAMVLWSPVCIFADTAATRVWEMMMI